MEINTFLDKLQSYHSEQVFNPWRDFDTSCDIGPQAPVIRSANLRRYLELRADAHYLFIAEALGYQGGHFSGIAITSERILLGHHPDGSGSYKKWTILRVSSYLLLVPAHNLY